MNYLHCLLNLVVLLCMAGTVSAQVQPKESRVALVIGNGTYKTSPLKNPVNDAKDMATKLRGLGFVVIERSNLGIRQIGSTLREFRSKLAPVAWRWFSMLGMVCRSRARTTCRLSMPT